MHGELPRTWSWTEADLERLDWHDDALHALGFDDEHADLELDLDHILEWIGAPDGTFEFLVAPATLVFHGVRDLTVNLEGAWTELTILGIHREGRTDEPRWTIELCSAGRDGSLTFLAKGFTQVVRHAPRRTRVQRLTRAERGGLSFSRRVAIP